MDRRFVTVDGNEAAAFVAHQTNEVIAIYPITPASPMGELSDAWTQMGRMNIFGDVPQVIEMQSEAGAAGVCHGALQAGALTTTFTASQGLLLMIPNMYKIAGELTASVFHIAARTLATHALSIFGDHSDIMAVRQTGWAILIANSVQEAHDFALIAQAATLKTRVPFLHCFDGFRTSHEVNKIEQLTADDLRALIDVKLIQTHRERALNPDRPVLRGSAQNPDVFFQAREAINLVYDAAPKIVQETMNAFASRTGRQYKLFDYLGAPDADRVIVLMGSGVGAITEAVEALSERGEKVGVLAVRLYRPFDASAFVAALPRATLKTLAVLDRCKEPGAVGEPLYQDVLAALAEGWDGRWPRVIGGRYGLSSKEFTPAMVAGVFREMAKDQPKRHFTVGIIDDVTHLSLSWDVDEMPEPADVTRAVFYGLGSDGTVGANKNTVKIIGEYTPLHAQGYFVYDSKKSGAITVSHLRFGPRPIRSTYLIRKANFVACHQFQFLNTLDVLEIAEPGATFLLNSPYPSDTVWDQLPVEVQRQIIEKRLRFFVVDGFRIAAAVGMEGRFNTVLQTCFFALSGVLPRDEAIAHIKEAIKKTYSKRGAAVLEKNYAAVDGALASLKQVDVPTEATSRRSRTPLVAAGASDFVNRVTAVMMAGKGDLLPVSALPVDGTFPTGTAKVEKRSIALEIPIWDADLCIQCGLCALVCPHAAIRSKAFDDKALSVAPAGFESRPWKGKELPGYHMTIQVAPDDCTGCNLCVEICPARSKQVVKHKALNMAPKADHLEKERTNFDYFLSIPELDRRRVKLETVKGSQLLEPLFEYSGACAGCGETPYLKLMSQLFGDRAVIANATGCSSIYGGNLPTTPWTTNADGRGPAWSNSLFEDNAEFGLGMRMALDQQESHARRLLVQLAPRVGEELAKAIVESPCRSETEVQTQRERVAELKKQLAGIGEPAARDLAHLAGVLVRRSVWIVGGDGWAYDIGFGGLDHVLASGRDVKIMVLDTEVYSNTGGQASKATPRAAVAKFAAGGKATGKKDLGMIAMAYGNVYVAHLAFAANPMQTLNAFREAESYPGPALLICYSHCIAHGIDMSRAVEHQKSAVATGYWPLFRFDPRLAAAGERSFHLDSGKPTRKFKEFAMTEGRFSMLAGANPDHAEHLMALAQADIDSRWKLYEQLAGLDHQASGKAEESAV